MNSKKTPPFSGSGFALAALVFATIAACGGGGYGGSSTPAATAVTPYPVPTVAAVSPNSSALGGASFTLSVVGSGFVSQSAVQLNGASLMTTLVNSNLLTAEVPASALVTPRANAVTVLNPAPGGSASSALTVSVPCVIPPLAPAAAQTRARVGAYFFDGWTGALTNFHFNGLPLGLYQDRQPLVGWQVNTSCAVEQQLATAHNFGVDFFIFDWYFNTEVNDPGENLKSALQLTRALTDRHGMQYAILYVSGQPFDVGPADWPAAVAEWVGYMTDPAYARVAGKPVLFVLNVGSVRQDFGTSAAVSAALTQLRAAAVAQGLPGVTVIGGFGAPHGSVGQESLDDGFSTAQQDGYDAVAFYAYPFAPPAATGPLPFAALAGAGSWTWDQAQLHLGLPFIPTAMAGWDPRPWNEVEPSSGDLMWYSRTPQDFSAFVASAVDWVQANPSMRIEPAPAAPIVIVEAWNEFGEGSYFLPTVGDGTAYGDALAAMLTGP